MDSLKICATISQNENLAENLLEAIEALVWAKKTVEDVRIDFKASPANSAAVLAALLKCLLGLKQARRLEDASLIRIVTMYHWHKGVIAILASMVRGREPFTASMASEIYKSIKQGLLSESSTIRLSTLLLLEHRDLRSAVVRQALEVERVPLTPQEAREKTMHLRRLGTNLKTADEGSEDLEMGFLYLLAMLKVNFRPLWSEAIDIICELSKTGGTSQKLLWQLISEQLHMVAKHSTSSGAAEDSPAWAQRAVQLDSIPEISAWRQQDLMCTAFSRLSSCFNSSCREYRELEGSGRRSTTHQDLEVSLCCRTCLIPD